MNKEEIEESKKCLNKTIQNTYAEGKSIKLDNLRKYIQHLEQKESILDKVTDKLNKNQASDYQVLTKTEDRLRKMSRKEYDTNGNGRYLADLRDILLNRIEYQQEILNIIEEEKK